MFGKELDHPLFFISPTIELSSEPLPPVYNLTMVAESNSRYQPPPPPLFPLQSQNLLVLGPFSYSCIRRHNFYLLSDVLTRCSIKREQLMRHCGLEKTLAISVSEFQKQLRRNPLNKLVPAPSTMESTGRSAKLEFIPLCNSLRQLLGTELANLDD